MRYLIASVAALAAATPALAQNAAPFTGPHVEALLGYDNINVPDDGAKGKDGLLYGVAAGYDFQVGGFIAGIEGEVADSTTKIRGNDFVTTGDRLRINTDRDLYIGARVGGEVTPGTLLYVKGGYTNLRLETDYDTTAGSTSFHNTLDGYRIGAGVETKFSLFGPSGFVKAEYRYSNYKNLNDNGSNVDIDLDRHQVVAGIGVRF